MLCCPDCDVRSSDDDNSHLSCLQISRLGFKTAGIHDQRVPYCKGSRVLDKEFFCGKQVCERGDRFPSWSIIIIIMMYNVSGTDNKVLENNKEQHTSKQQQICCSLLFSVCDARNVRIIIYILTVRCVSHRFNCFFQRILCSTCGLYAFCIHLLVRCLARHTTQPDLHLRL